MRRRASRGGALAIAACGLGIAGLAAVSHLDGGERAAGLAAAALSQKAEAAGYADCEIRGWAVRVSSALLDADPELADEALEALDAQLAAVAESVPGERLSFLRTVPIRLEWKNRAFEGAVYHPLIEGAAPAGLSREKAGSIELPSAAGFLRKVREQPMLLLHELAHAFHQQKVGFRERSILDAFAQAKRSGIYNEVERSGVHGPPVRAYALKNSKEYFAELTEAYFGRNDYFPFTREELATHDPAGFAAIRDAWEQPTAGVEPAVRLRR